MRNLVGYARGQATPAARRAAWNLAWMLGGTALSQLCLLAVVLVLTGVLGREQFGIFSTALAIQTYIVLFGSAGMPAVVVREMVQRPADRAAIASTFLAIALSLGLVSAAAIALVVAFLGISPEEKLLLGILSLGAAAACANPVALFDALHRQALPAIAMALADLVLLACVLAGWHWGVLSLVRVGVLFSAKWVLLVLLLVAVVRRLVPVSPRQVRLSEVCQLWRSSWSILLASLLAMVPIAGGTLFVRWFRGPAEAAIMGLATQVLQAYVMLAALAHRLMRPHVAGVHGFQRSFMLKLAAFYATFLSSLYVGALVVVELLVRCFLPPGYADALWPCRLAATAGLVAGTATIFHNYLLVQKRERAILVGYFAAALSAAVGSIAVTPCAGAIGQSLVAIGSHIALLALNVFLVSCSTWRARPLTRASAKDAVDSGPA
ncbi:MAG: oligosaccharide flippase family protein [Thermoguttaceae bacterium]|nr:oligosaccharide flippase family protein [Thermoguttaceae bacterium]